MNVWRSGLRPRFATRRTRDAKVRLRHAAAGRHRAWTGTIRPPQVPVSAQLDLPPARSPLAADPGAAPALSRSSSGKSSNLRAPRAARSGRGCSTPPRSLRSPQRSGRRRRAPASRAGSSRAARTSARSRPMPRAGGDGGRERPALGSPGSAPASSKLGFRIAIRGEGGAPLVPLPKRIVARSFWSTRSRKWRWFGPEASRLSSST
jgi:hypothetical protein